MSDATPLEPRMVCEALLAALDASEGRRRKRKRDTTADSIGLTIKRKLLERGVDEAPAAADFEAWLIAQCEVLGGEGYGIGPVRAMAKDILDDWRLALEAPSFREWLAHGAPSADADE
jgi:hypothetical protein